MDYIWKPKLGEKLTILTTVGNKIHVVITRLEESKLWCQEELLMPEDFGSDFGSDDFDANEMPPTIQEYMFKNTSKGWTGKMGKILTPY